MRQFGFLQIIARPPYVSAPPIVHHKDLDSILDNFYNHLVPYKLHDMLTLDQWVVGQGYFHWFNQVSHPYMTSDIAGAPPRPVYPEILEEE